jgi:predicted Zn-dependent protease
MRAPAVRAAFAQATGQQGEIQPIDAVARGAAIYALAVLGDCLGAEAPSPSRAKDGPGTAAPRDSIEAAWQDVRRLLHAGRSPDALRAYEDFLTQAHGEAAAGYGKLVATLQSEAGIDTLATLIERGLRHDPGNGWLQEQGAGLMTATAEGLLRSGRVHEAVKRLEDILRKFPQAISAPVRVAGVFAELAEACWREATDTNRAQRRKVEKQVLGWLRRSLELDPRNPRARALKSALAGHAAADAGGRGET